MEIQNHLYQSVAFIKSITYSHEQHENVKSGCFAYPALSTHANDVFVLRGRYARAIKADCIEGFAAPLECC